MLNLAYQNKYMDFMVKNISFCGAFDTPRSSLYDGFRPHPIYLYKNRTYAKPSYSSFKYAF